MYVDASYWKDDLNYIFSRATITVPDGQVYEFSDKIPVLHLKLKFNK